MENYDIQVFYSEEDEGYIADIPDLKFCSAFGSTPAEAVQEVEIAKSVWLEAAKAASKLIPEPTIADELLVMKNYPNAEV